VRVTFNGEVIADTRDAIKLEESGYVPVYYVSRQDVKMESLTRTGHRIYCPFKGHASYYTLFSGERTEQNAVWSDEQAYGEVGVISERLVFYPNNVDRINSLPA
jgi:uncharacterized protein (DUF427 family)